MTELPKTYEPAAVEGRIYSWWLENGWFAAEQNTGEPKFCIVIPPPNVTGILHMGHALNCTIQDALVRRARMMGVATLWLPGTDHAGIATQNVVERRLAEEGTDRHALGREKFVERTWAWKDEYESRILEQFKRLGASCDWSRTRFTMDAGLSTAVRKVFVQLFDDGLIYRGNRIINWCPRCTSTISDIEVRHQDVAGELITISYPLTQGGTTISVATTRVETMLGDTAIAVNPNDARYASLVGQTATLPLVGREIPIIADDAVDPSFGTGAVKVTPAHDPNDFEIAERHGLEAVNIFDKQAAVNENGGRFAGLDRLDARKAVFDALEKEGRIENIERPYIHSVGHCDRCDTIIEPWLSEQWFVKMKPLAEPAAKVVRDGEVVFVPEKPFKKSYLDWMDNIRDWTISRQLWWGHRIPIWYCANGHMFAATEDPTACAECGATEIEQDPDVLDTWFSAWLWPFSTLGWPEQTADLSNWYPTTTLVTAYEIIYLWVARMIAGGLYLMKAAPFKTVVIHGIVRDFEGKKMSKSKGNAVDPIEWIDQYGTDALRFTLARTAIPGQDTNVSEDWIEGDRRFANKIYNAARFVLTTPTPTDNAAADDSLASRWIRSRLARAASAVNQSFADHNLADAARTLYDFIWSEYCDWYLEASKLNPAAAATTLRTTLRTALQLLHPIMPFITEELWSKLGGESAIMISKWPTDLEEDATAENQMSIVMETVTAIRSFRHDNSFKPKEPIDLSVTATPEVLQVLQEQRDLISSLANVGQFEFGTNAHPTRFSVSFGDLWLPAPSDQFLETTEKRKEEARRIAQRSEGKLNNKGFMAKAPPEVVEKVTRDLKEAQAILDA